MKTKLLKLSFLALMLIAFFGCNDCKECEKENQILKEKLETIEKSISKPDEENNSGSNQTYDKHSLKKYGVKGYFSIKEKKFYAIIPTTETGLVYKETRFISMNGTNAILIRIDDANSNSCTNDNPIKDFIEVEKAFTNRELDLTELENDKKLMVIVINSDGTDLEDYINEYKKRINQHKYNIGNVLINTCKQPLQIFDDMKPNEDGGDIITGG